LLKREQAEEREKILNVRVSFIQNIREKSAKIQKAKEDKERLEKEK
jgi:Rad3-related DNA helicase